MSAHDDWNEVEAAVRALLAANPRFPAVIVNIHHRPSEYRSSFVLEEIDVQHADGRTTSLMFKDLAWRSLTNTGQRAKPAFLYDPMREIEVYRGVLAGKSLGTPRYHGSVVDASRGRYWLFIEKAPGVELYQFGELEAWCHAARWLAQTHSNAALLDAAKDRNISPHLIRYDGAFYRRWIDRAVEFVAKKCDNDARKRLGRLALRYDRIAEDLAALPATFIHGEFYASNVLLDIGRDSPRVCPVDWEIAGLGPGVMDLAALVVGKWSAHQRNCMVAEYRSALPPDHPWAADLAGLDLALARARLHVAVQRLGWSANWEPPAAHAHDWLSEALLLAEELHL